MIACIILKNAKVFDDYENHAFQKKLQSFYEGFTPYLESYSPQGFFLELGREAAALHTTLKLWRSLIPAYGQEAIIGLASSKLLSRAIILLGPKAKLLPGLEVIVRPQGLLIKLPSEMEKEIRPQLPLETLWPLETKLRQRLMRLGLKTWGEVAELPPERLKSQIGDDAYFLWELVQGRLRESLKVSTVGRIEMPIPLEEGMSDLGPSLERVAEELAIRLREQQLGCRELILEGITQEGESFSQKRLFAKPCSSLMSFKGEIYHLWQKLDFTTWPRQMFLKADGLETANVEQLSLFTNSNKGMKEEQLTKLLNRLRQDYPTNILDWAGHGKISRREQMLAFYDPWRQDIC